MDNGGKRFPGPTWGKYDGKEFGQLYTVTVPMQEVYG